MGKQARDKGRRGQREASELLRSRDWNVVETNAGTAVEDFVAIDPQGKAHSVEVKNTVSITTTHRAQAMAQAKARRLPWMLLSRVSGTTSWLVQRQGQRPAIWHSSADIEDAPDTQ